MFNAIKPKSIEELRSFIEKEKITNLQAEFLKNLFVMESLSVRGDIKDPKYKYKIIDEIVNIMLDININN